MLLNKFLLEDHSHKTLVVLDRSPKFAMPASARLIILRIFTLLTQDKMSEDNQDSQPIQQTYPALLYRDKPQWRDVKPIYNSEREDAVIRIASTEEFIDAFAYLRAMLNLNELSERALELTKHCVWLNAANYSVWQYRRNILRALNKPLADEIRFCDETINDNPKNYQVWHHRRALVEELGVIEFNPSTELGFVAFMLEDDAKNYHAWQYRHWLIERFNLYSQDEVNFSTQLLLQDVFNNSAWNYRYFIIANLSECFKDTVHLLQEITFTLECIKRHPENESAWSYLSGILLNDGLNMHKNVQDFCQELLTQDPPCSSPHLYNFLVDCLVEKLEKGIDDFKTNVETANKYLSTLEELDPIRTNYWKYRRTFIDNLVASKSHGQKTVDEKKLRSQNDPTSS